MPNPRPPRRAAATEAEARAYVNPTPDDQLTDRDRLEIKVLDELDNAAFDRRVNEWVTTPDADGSGIRVFFSAQLVARTFEATGRLISETERKFRRARGNPRAFTDLEAHKDRLVRVRARAKAIRTTVYQQNVAESERQRAYRLLSKVYPAEFRRVHNMLREGITPDEVVARMREEKNHP